MGVNDDWTYIWSADVLARTGHIAYSGWGAMPLGWQLYLGALLIKLFGYTFTAPRLGVFAVSLCTAGLMQRVLVRCGATEQNACFGALTVALSPLFLPLSFTFMSDIPALFCLLVCMYGCVRALESPTARGAIGWLVFAAASNVALGTVRQIAWLGVLVMVPATAWCMRRRRGLLAAGAASWLIGAAAIFAFLRWFRAQPYTFGEPLKPKHSAAAQYDIHCLFTTLLWATPVFLAFLVRFPFRRRWKWAVTAGAVVVVYLLATRLTQAPREWLFPFSLDEVSLQGIDIPNELLGLRPEVIHPAAAYPLTVLSMSAWLACVYFVTGGRRAEVSDSRAGRSLSTTELFWLVGPFSAAYLLLIITRESIWDRYWIPLLFVLVLVLLRMYQGRVGLRLPVLSYAVLVLVAAFSVMGTHDLFATLRARLGAAEALEAAGIPRGSMYAGIEFDGWTQLLLNGHVNNPRVKNPPNSYRRYLDPPSTKCRPWWESWVPDIHADYELSYQPLSCVGSTQYGPFPYRTWLAPRLREIYVLGKPPGLITISSSPGAAATMPETSPEQGHTPVPNR